MTHPVIAIAILAGCGRVGFAPEARDAAGDGVADSGDAARACMAPTSGLLGHWTLDTADVVGASVLDASGNGRNGTLVGTPRPVVVAGRIGDALDFAGTSSAYIELASVPLVGTDGAFNTIAFWFYTDDPTPDEALVYLPEGPGATPPRYDLWLNYYSDNVVSLCVNTGISECWGVQDPNLIGRWVHVAVAFYNGLETSSIMYVDGVNANASCVFGSCVNSRNAMGPLRMAGNEAIFAWHGRFDDVRAYNRALSPAEVAALYDCAP